MDRLGPYIFIFLFLGLTFFERARTKGETGSLWLVLARNFAVFLFAAAGYLFFGVDLIDPDSGKELFETAKSMFGSANRIGILNDLLRPGLLSVGASLIVAAGMWELRLRFWFKWAALFCFTFIIYPLFGRLEAAQTGLYDFAGALLNWSLPAAFVLGIRLLVPAQALPEERKHSLKGINILPGMKHRFLVSRGIGFTMVFLVLNATTLTGSSWVLSKTLTLISASFTILFCNFFFFGLFGRNDMDRISYAPPLLAIMATLTATQACNEYASHQAILAAVVTTFAAMLYLRTVPLKIRYWDPVCSTPVFLIGGISGALIATITEPAKLLYQIPGVIACLAIGCGSGAAISLLLSRFALQKAALKSELVAPHH